MGVGVACSHGIKLEGCCGTMCSAHGSESLRKFDEAVTRDVGVSFQQ